jgi:hypothetical protein
MGGLLAGCAIHRFTGILKAISNFKFQISDMAWRELTEDDVLGVLSEPEKAAYESAAAGAGQDVLTDIIGQVVNHCRGYIADNRENQLAEGTTLPERVLRPALHLIRKDLLTRLDLEVSEDRRKDAAEAIRFFERVADGKVTIEQPTGAIDTSGPQTLIDVVQSNPHVTTRDTLAGL